MTKPANTDTWFTESQLPYAQQDVKVSLRTTKKLYDEKGEFGHIEVFETPFVGNMLAIDGIIQVAEKDEFIYHEMMVALPSIKHGNPKSMLIIGGGDGGAAKMALKTKSLQKIVQVEIDDKVVKLSEEFLPSVSDGAMRSDKIELVIADGYEYIQKCTDKFDIVVLDLTDPVPGGPAEKLFSQPFYETVKNLLSDGGYMSTHCGSLLFQVEEAKELRQRLSAVFADVSLHHAVIPSYQLSLFGFLISSPVKSSSKPNFDVVEGQLQYLTPEVLKASTVRPPYLEKQLQ